MITGGVGGTTHVDDPSDLALQPGQTLTRVADWVPRPHVAGLYPVTVTWGLNEPASASASLKLIA